MPGHKEGDGMNFGILVFPNVEELDFIGPWEILSMWRKYAQAPAYIKNT
jgi:hypothetical protein